MQKIKNYLLNISLLWSIILPIQIVGIYAIIEMFSTHDIGLLLVYIFCGYTMMMLFGVSAIYHRLCSHRSYTCPRAIKLLGLWCGALAGQGSALWWAGLHRGYHHKYTDREGDPHSPVDGFWHSYILWMSKIADKQLNKRALIDLLRDKDIIFFHDHYKKIVFLSYAIISMIDSAVLLYAFCVPAMLTLHAFSLTTSFGHLRGYGYRNYDQDNNSVNVPVLFPFIFGDAWHNNHHARPGDACFGTRWWEIDPTHWIIKLIKR